MSTAPRRYSRAPRSVSDLKFGEVLGKGLFGKVYAANHKVTGEPYAVKEISGRSLKSKLEFLKEAQVLRTVRHEYLLRLVSVLVQESKDDTSESEDDEDDDDDDEDESGEAGPDLERLLRTGASDEGEDDGGDAEDDGKGGEEEEGVAARRKTSSSRSSRFRRSRRSRRKASSVSRGPQLSYKCYLVTQFCSGGSLSALLLDHDEYLPWPTRTRWAYQAACGLRVLHANNVIHRDLKSDNCLLKLNGEKPDAMFRQFTLVLGDFGLSRWYRSSAVRIKSERRLKALSVCGTPWSMAPELMVAKKSSGYSIESEIFTFGVLIIEMLTRRRAKDVPRDDKTLAVDMRAVQLMSHNPSPNDSDYDDDPGDTDRRNSKRSDPKSLKGRDSIGIACPPPLLRLASECVHLNPQKRPSITAICARLESMMY